MLTKGATLIYVANNNFTLWLYLRPSSLQATGSFVIYLESFTFTKFWLPENRGKVKATEKYSDFNLSVSNPIPSTRKSSKNMRRTYSFCLSVCKHMKTVLFTVTVRFNLGRILRVWTRNMQAYHVLTYRLNIPQIRKEIK